MQASSGTERVAGPYRRFIDRLEPGERLGEILFGLIMVLTFTLGASVQLQDDPEGAHELLLSALGCNVAWGIIDAVLYLMGQLSERGRLHRIAERVRSAKTEDLARGIVVRELDHRIPHLVGPEMRIALEGEVLARVRGIKPAPNRVTLQDLWPALAVFWLVFLTAVPAALPFLVIRDAQVALRTSNTILIGLLFWSGWRWAAYTGGTPWRTGAFMVVTGVALVAVAIALGG